MSTEQGDAAGRGGGWVRVVAVIAGLVLLALLGGRRVGGLVPGFAAWVDTLGFWGPVAFAAGYVLGTVTFVPSSALSLAAGAVFGISEGVAVVFVGASVGATLAFLIARHLVRGWVERRLAGNDRFAAVDRAVGREGIKIVFLLRLSPVFPFNLLNYALGVTSVRLGDYVIACVGMLPGTLLYVYSGKILGDVAAVAGGAGAARDTGYWMITGLGLMATALVAMLVTRIARRALREEVGDV